MKCPICAVDLNMSERHGVEINYCPKCRGVWLDRGELDKIIEQATEPTLLPDPEARAPAPQSQMRQEPYHEDDTRRAERDDRRYKGKYSDDDDRYRKKKRRKSILAEIFDFDFD